MSTIQPGISRTSRWSAVGAVAIASTPRASVRLSTTTSWGARISSGPEIWPASVAGRPATAAGTGASTKTCRPIEGTGPSSVGRFANSRYGPAGVTARSVGALTVRVAPSRSTTGSTTERWSPSIRWVRAVLRISTTVPSSWTAAASSAEARVTVNVVPVSTRLGASWNVGRSPRNRYGGE